MAKKTKKGLTTRRLNIPGFNGEASLGPSVGVYQGRGSYGAGPKGYPAAWFSVTVGRRRGRLLEM